MCYLSVYCRRSIIIYMCFFFKQKTAYEIEYGLVGSEMCIRDRNAPIVRFTAKVTAVMPMTVAISCARAGEACGTKPVSYTHLTLPTSDLV